MATLALVRRRPISLPDRTLHRPHSHSPQSQRRSVFNAVAELRRKSIGLPIRCSCSEQFRPPTGRPMARDLFWTLQDSSTVWTFFPPYRTPYGAGPFLLPIGPSIASRPFLCPTGLLSLSETFSASYRTPLQLREDEPVATHAEGWRGDCGATVAVWRGA
jgi:hypothetical protein